MELLKSEQLFIHPFIVNNKKLNKYKNIEGFEKFLPSNSNDVPPTNRMVSGLILNQSEDFISNMVNNLGLPYIDYDILIKSQIPDLRDFRIYRTHDMFLGIRNPNDVEFIQVQDNIYPFPGIPRIYTLCLIIQTHS
jgi:hypothetical protein